MRLIGEAFALWALRLAWKKRRSFDDLWERGGPLPARGANPAFRFTGLLASERDWPGLSWRYLPGHVACHDVRASTYHEHLRDGRLLTEIRAMLTEDGPPPIMRVVWM